MPAYVVALVKPLDKEGIVKYREIAAEAIARYGGRYVIRGGGLIADTLEGELPDAERAIVLEFPDLAAAKGWWESPEYAPAREIAETAMRRTMIVAEGE
ncbi:MAG: DUF1330 domain-containing protein [Actinobacteria bacterium]|nr:DUF1330 domain-containing protein [Actinomycetota bacterium]